MSLIEKIKRALTRGNQAPAPATAQERRAQALAQHLNASSGPTLMVGVSGCGKSQLLDKMAPQLQGCVVRLQAQYHLADAQGWEEAPFWGILRLADGSEEDWELPDVLRLRPAGVFELTLPWSAGDNRLQRALQRQLLELLNHDCRGTPLTVILDEAPQLCDREALLPLLMQGRSLRTNCLFSCQTLGTLTTAMRVQFSRLCVMRTLHSDAEQIRGWVGIAALRFEELGVGEAAWVEPLTGRVLPL